MSSKFLSSTLRAKVSRFSGTSGNNALLFEMSDNVTYSFGFRGSEVKESFNIRRGISGVYSGETPRTMATDIKDRNRKNLTLDSLNPGVKVMEYVVRGPVVIRAGEIERELKNGASRPFQKILQANIGDCHASGQKPITFIRQVLALVSYPELIKSADFPEDAKSRAIEILKGCQGGSVGSYTDAPGIELIRKHCAEYIERRDGHPCDWQDIVLGAGASDCIKGILKLFICDVGCKKPGIMVPIPQFPLYSASLAEFNIHQISYFLDESKLWGLTLPELQRSIEEAKLVSHPRALVVINPGNPTGQVLTEKNIQEIIKFAHQENLMILADEVYQDNIYADRYKFHSFKKVMTEMGDPYSKVELASFMSCSKGYLGECGLRAGYVEILNMDPDVKTMYMKAITTSLCSSVGQAVINVFCNPPRKGEPSYEQFTNEKMEILGALKQRAQMVEKAFDGIEGISCNPVQGAMYAFPQIKLPPRAIEAAKKENKPPDDFYAFRLLEETGICIVPGSGFGQVPGTYHFRTTILPETHTLKEMLLVFKSFHEKFLVTYS